MSRINQGNLAQIERDLAPTGALRVTINLGNPVLTSGSPEDPGGITVAIARRNRLQARRPN